MLSSCREIHNLEILTTAQKFSLQKFYLLENSDVIFLVDLFLIGRNVCFEYVIHLRHSVNFISFEYIFTQEVHKNQIIGIFLQRDFPELCSFEEVTAEEEGVAVCPLIYPHPSGALGKIKQWECTWISKCDRAECVIDERNKR